MDNNLKKLRKLFKLTQLDLAVQVHATRQTIIAIENNKQDPSLSLALRIAKALNSRVEDIFNTQ